MSNRTLATLLATHFVTYPVQATLPAPTVVDASHAPVPQTQLAPSTSSASVSGAFADQNFTAPAISATSRDEKFRQNAAVAEALEALAETIVHECSFSKYAAPTPRTCIQEKADEKILGLLEENVAIIVEEQEGNLKTLKENVAMIAEFEMPLDKINGKLNELQKLVASANTK